MVCVVSLYMPGPNTSATLPSLTNTAICDSRTVREAPYWISRSRIGKRQASVPSPSSVHWMMSMNCFLMKSINAMIRSSGSWSAHDKAGPAAWRKKLELALLGAGLEASAGEFGELMPAGHRGHDRGSGHGHVHMRHAHSRRALRAGDRQQPVVLVLDHAIAAARAGFQGPAVLHRECAAAATDDAGLTQPAGGFGDAFAPHAQQPRSEFLRQRHLVVRHPVQAHQEQTAKLLLDRVMAIAHHELG